eukprot:snap_masked-scaffold_6-processed-gene-16.48-mRNA-1 protein AED:1.00 eAED:1.00 QI:0/-1/0/0/-1/1/1/0/234
MENPKRETQSSPGLLKRLCTLILLCFLMLSNVGLYTIFGHGTGKNKAYVSPLDLSANIFLSSASPVNQMITQNGGRKVVSAGNNLFAMLYTPKVVFEDFKTQFYTVYEVNLESFSIKKKVASSKGVFEKMRNLEHYRTTARKQAQKTTRTLALNEALIASKDRGSKEHNYVVVGGGIACLMSIFLAFFNPKTACYLYIGGLLALYVGLSGYQNFGVTNYAKIYGGAAILFTYIL